MKTPFFGILRAHIQHVDGMKWPMSAEADFLSTHFRGDVDERRKSVSDIRVQRRNLDAIPRLACHMNWWNTVITGTR